MPYTNTVKLCPWCKGKGEYEIEFTDGRTTIHCTLCNGSGYVPALNGEGYS